MRKIQIDKLKKLETSINARKEGDKLVALGLGYKSAEEAFRDIGTDFIKACRESNHFASINKSMLK